MNERSKISFLSKSIQSDSIDGVIQTTTNSNPSHEYTAPRVLRQQNDKQSLGLGREREVVIIPRSGSGVPARKEARVRSKRRGTGSMKKQRVFRQSRANLLDFDRLVLGHQYY